VIDKSQGSTGEFINDGTTTVCKELGMRQSLGLDQLSVGNQDEVEPVLLQQVTLGVVVTPETTGITVVGESLGNTDSILLVGQGSPRGGMKNLHSPLGVVVEEGREGVLDKGSKLRGTRLGHGTVPHVERRVLFLKCKDDILNRLARLA
jgi:hypothetical protein